VRKYSSEYLISLPQFTLIDETKSWHVSDLGFADFSCLYVDAPCRDFVLNPHNHRRLLADCDKFDWPKEWPNSKGINACTERANVRRKPLPLEHFLEHKMAKLAGLDKTEVCRLCGGRYHLMKEREAASTSLVCCDME
jgi:hypothetical protein